MTANVKNTFFTVKKYLKKYENPFHLIKINIPLTFKNTFVLKKNVFRQNKRYSFWKL